MPRLFDRRFLFLLVLLMLGHGRGGAANDAVYVPRNDPGRIQALVNALLARLSMPVPVAVTVVAANPLLVSVESRTDTDGFLLSLEDGFIDGLDDEELQGVIAHELGHVWIFTHHPYLQTEPLANRIALRLVTRETLERVYVKVWERNGSKGDLVRFLGN